MGVNGSFREMFPAGQSLPEGIPEDMAKLGFQFASEHVVQLATFVDLLLLANRRFNLTAVRDIKGAWRRHVIDSLTLVPFIEKMNPAGQRLVDVGSGGGLPGIPVAITQPNLNVFLIEATGKKASFLEDVVRELKLTNCHVLAERAERIGQQAPYRERFDLAVCRAIGPLREVLEYVLPLVRIGGHAIAFKGPSVLEELPGSRHAAARLGGGVPKAHAAYPSWWNNRSALVLIEKKHPTPDKYPRSPGIAKRSPL